MPKSTCERVKNYRKRLKNNPDKYLAYKCKDRARRKKRQKVIYYAKEIRRERQMSGKSPITRAEEEISSGVTA